MLQNLAFGRLSAVKYSPAAASREVGGSIVADQRSVRLRASVDGHYFLSLRKALLDNHESARRAHQAVYVKRDGLIARRNARDNRII